jgi:WD40 repeat protein
VQGHRGPVYATADRSIGGKLLAGASHDKWVRLWDVGSGKELKRLRHRNRAHSVTAVAWSFDGKFLASGGTDCRIILWDAKRGERLTKLKGFYHPVSCLQFNPTDAGQLVIGSWDNTVELWSVADGQCQQTLTGPVDQVRDGNQFPDGQGPVVEQLERVVQDDSAAPQTLPLGEDKSRQAGGGHGKLLVCIPG